MPSTATPLKLITWNIHKGVHGMPLMPRLEIHNIAQAIAGFEADLVCLQEVRKFNTQLAKRFANWPDAAQADFLAPKGFDSVYETNATTRHGEHGNALLARHTVLASQQQDMSDHALEQRGLLHVVLQIHDLPVHVIVVHLGLLHRSRVRQIQLLDHYIAKHVPAGQRLIVAGDFNDWGERLHLHMRHLGLHTLEGQRHATFPARLPVLTLDRVYVRGVQLQRLQVIKSAALARMSDHLPLLAHLVL